MTNLLLKIYQSKQTVFSFNELQLLSKNTQAKNLKRQINYYVKILKKIYQNPLLQTTLGFKGGTALYLFYKLPRFSTDLDFDLIRQNNTTPFQQTCSQAIIVQQLKQIIEKFGLEPNFSNKKNTLFFC